MGGVADAITAGATDFDKRGTGIGQMNLGEKMSKKKVFKNNARVKNHIRDMKSNSFSSSGNGEGIISMLSSGNRAKIQQGLYQMRISAAQGSGKGMNDWVGNPKYDKDVALIMEHGLGSVEINGGRVKLQAKVNAKNVKTTPQNTTVPTDPKKTPKVVNVPSSGAPSGANNTGSPGGGTVNVSGNSGGGPTIAFPPSHNGVSYAAVETQSQMNLVMAD